VVCAFFGCSSDAPPGASVALEVTLPDSPLARMQNATLLRAGDSFTLAGYENGQVRWGRLSLAGSLSGETGFALDPPVLGPKFATTMKAAPGDQLIAISVTNSTTPGSYDLTAVVQTLGDATAAAPVVLYSFPTGTDPKLVQFTAGAAVTGNMGFVAWGTQVDGVPIQYLALSADAAHAATPGTALGPDTSIEASSWDCLLTTNGSTGLGFSVIYSLKTLPYSDWHVAELDESGGLTEMSYGLLAQPTECEIVGSPTAKGGYDIAFKDSKGIGFATYTPSIDPSQSGNVTTYEVAMSPQSFGNPLQQPAPVYAAAAGSDITIGLSRASGHLVTRFTFDAVPHGSRLSLRTQSGQAGPLSAWVGSDYVYVTYADQVSASGTTTTKRYFTKIESPAKLP
jgi:hypothetical protein